MAPSSTSGLAPLGRVFWIMVGPALLFLLAVIIARVGGGWLTGYDFAFFVLMGCLLFGRWLEFRGGEPRTADGEPATPSHLRRYAAGLLLVGLAVWVGANWIGNARP